MIWQGIVVFSIMFGLDIVWALYTHAMVDKRPLAASFHAMMIQALSGALVLEYTKEPVLLIPAMAGAFAGTYVVMRGWFQWLFGRAIQMARLWGGRKAPPKTGRP